MIWLWPKVVVTENLQYASSHLHAARIGKAEFDSTLEKKTDVVEVRLIESKLL